MQPEFDTAAFKAALERSRPRLNQRELARQIGVGEVALSAMVRGVRRYDPDMAANIAATLKVPLLSLLVAKGGTVLGEDRRLRSVALVARLGEAAVADLAGVDVAALRRIVAGAPIDRKVLAQVRERLQAQLDGSDGGTPARAEAK